MVGGSSDERELEFFSTVHGVRVVAATRTLHPSALLVDFQLVAFE
jgi:hypothetical protein